jgi:rhodanese-related sulfurtransferase
MVSGGVRDDTGDDLLEDSMPALPKDERPVTDIPAADPQDALAHFSRLLAHETDCWDVHAALLGGHPGFVVLDVRGPEAFAEGHVKGAVNLPHRRINERNLAPYPVDTVFVVYCAGPHCNGADRAGLALARLGRRVKKMIGGVTGWKDEGFELQAG